jgi:hypothetical protein
MNVRFIVLKGLNDEWITEMRVDSASPLSILKWLTETKVRARSGEAHSSFFQRLVPFFPAAGKIWTILSPGSHYSFILISKR